MPSNWIVFQALCRILGGHDSEALRTTLAAGMMPQVISVAARQDVLPALAVRCFELVEQLKELPPPTKHSEET